MRMLHVKNGLVTNVVEYAMTPPAVADDGADVVPDLTGTLNYGSPYDVTQDLLDRKYAELPRMVLFELFRLTNAIRALQTPAQPALTTAQYKSFLKSL